MVDVRTAEHRGICPACEGYGGDPSKAGEDCSNELCDGSCPACWCPGCHDGQIRPSEVTPELSELDREEWSGSFEAYAALHRGRKRGSRPRPGQEALVADETSER